MNDDSFMNNLFKQTDLIWAIICHSSAKH